MQQVDADQIARAVAQVLQAQQEPRFRDVDEALVGFRAWLLGRNRRDSTAQMYLRYLGSLRSKYGIDLLNLNQNVVLIWTARAREDGLKASTVSMMYSVLRVWCKYTKQRDAMDEVESPVVDKGGVAVLPDHELIERFRDAMRVSKHNHSAKANAFRRDGLVWDMMYTSAFRVSEVLNLQLDDVLVKRPGGFRIWDPRSSEMPTHVWVRGETAKRHQSGRVPLTAATARELAYYIRVHREQPPAGNPHAGYVFLIRSRPRAPWRKLSPKTYRRRLSDFADLLGPEYKVLSKTHHGRRTRLSDLSNRGMQTQKILRISRHKSEAELQPYLAGVEQEGVDEAFRHYSGVRKRAY